MKNKLNKIIYILIMSSILYYSNFCQHSKKIIGVLSKSEIQQEIHFICIDNREKGPKGETIILLENNQKVILHSSVTRVPALLLLNQNYKVLFGEEILSYLKPKEEVINQVATNNNGEPSAFALSSMSGPCGIVSDQYSFLDQSSEDLSAKGSGGGRQMHNYATLNYSDKIQTPDDNYTPNKIDEGEINKYREEREKDVNMKNTPMPNVKLSDS
tara:strand:+ start:1328 stop:1969 length:642 start_codon:yes stop_codon:yes gene_type:complete